MIKKAIQENVIKHSSYGKKDENGCAKINSIGL